jgi:hypothetical protein
MDSNRIFNKQQFDAGYDDGYNDAIKGYDNPVKYMTGNSYNDGYYTGYIKACRINTSNTTINHTIMARNTSFEHQLELAESLKSYLHGFQERLGDVAQNYKNKCNQLYEAGMMDEFHKDFEQNYMQATIQKIAAVVEQINEADIPFIEKFIDYLESNPSAK